MAAVLVVGLTAVVSQSAGAHGHGPSGPGVNLFVGTNGTDTGNICLSKTVPCATIGRALTVEPTFNSTVTIHVAKGTYVGQVTIGQPNTGVTIVGSKKTIIEAPSSALQATSDPNSPNGPVSNCQYYVMRITPGASNITLQSLTISGANGIGSIPTVLPGSCSQGQAYAGIYVDDASATLKSVVVSGIDMPVNQISSAGEGRGIYVASDASGTSTVDMSAVSMLSPACLTKTTVPLTAASYNAQNLPIGHISQKSACRGWTGGPILVGGALVTATALGSRTIEITGTVPYDLPAGASVNFANPYRPAYSGAGIVCQDSRTYCSVSGSTLQGEGPSDVVSQTGVEVDGASAAVDDNKVSGHANTCGALLVCAAGNAPGSGIAVVDAGTLDISANTVSANDVNIHGCNDVSAACSSWAPSGLLTPSAGRAVTGAATTASSSTLTAMTGAFTPADVGRSVTDLCPCSWNSFADGVATGGSATFTSATANFTTADIGKPILDNGSTTGTGPGGAVIAPGTKVLSLNSPSSVQLSQNPTCATSCATVAFYLPARTGVSPGTVIVQWVSSNVVLLSQPATQSATRSVTLGPLPGGWSITGNTASAATASGASTGVAGFGDGIELDSTDPNFCGGPSNPAVVVQGNTADQNPGSGILLSGASCATIGGAVLGQGNTASANQVGLSLSGPGSAGFASTLDTVAGNSFSGNVFGVVASGFSAIQQYGGVPSALPGSQGNSMTANTWTGNSLAAVIDFTDWAPPAGLQCLSVCSLTLTASQTDAANDPTTGLVAGVPYNLISVTSVPALGLAAGTLLRITEGGRPTVNVLVTAAVPSGGPTFIPVTLFTPGGPGYDTGAAVAISPYAAPQGPANTWGAGNSCNPSPNGAGPFDSLTFGAGYGSC